jgi:hypothetical protein
MKRWTDEELNTLRKHYRHETGNLLQRRLPGRSLGAIHQQASKMGLTGQGPIEWLGERPCTGCKKVKPLSEFAKCRDRLTSRCIECLRAYPTYKANPEKARVNSFRSHLKRKFNLTEAEYLALLDAQHGVCRICGEPPNTKTPGGSTQDKLCVDHDHTTGAIRGLLCVRCNTGLGYFRDNVELLHAAINYLAATRTLVLV